MVNKLAEGPIAVCVDAGDCWRFYSEGLITSDMGCGTGLNHAVVIGKYTPAVPATTTTEEVCEPVCIKHYWRRRN